MNNTKDYPYEDIIALPHPASKKHHRMSALDRAAQFSPFAALNGYDEVIEEQIQEVADFFEKERK